MIELLTQIVILITAVVGLVKLSGMSSQKGSNESEGHGKVELPSWLNGLGDLIEFASVYAFVLVPLGVMYAFMWVTNEMSSIGDNDVSDKNNAAIIEHIESHVNYDNLKKESEQAFFNIIVAKEATTTSFKHELLDKAYQYSISNNAYENALFAATEYNTSSKKNEKLEELVKIFNDLGRHELSLKAAKEASTSALKNQLLNEIYDSKNKAVKKPNKQLNKDSGATAPPPVS